MRLPLVVFFILAGAMTLAQTNILLEAESATLSGSAAITNCSNASGGQMVKDINNGTANAVLFPNVPLPQGGVYYITLSYVSNVSRNFTYQLNGKPAVVKAIAASGPWCYQGGFPADFTFQDTFLAGNNDLLFYNAPIIDKITISQNSPGRAASTFYISSSAGDDNNDGSAPNLAWQTLAKVNALPLVPGDSLLFKAGDTFVGELKIINEGGQPGEPIFIGSYGAGNKPIIDGDGYLSSFHIQNSSYIHLDGLELKNDGGPSRPGNPTHLRYGLYIQNTLADGTVFSHYRINDFTFKNIYPTDTITDDDQTGIHAYGMRTSGSWGDTIHPTRFDDMRIENCLFTRTGRHALLLTSVNDLEIKNNLFEHVGGAGMVIGANSTNVLVAHNITNYTGSNIDKRMAARGSGLWAFRTKNLIVQHNQFKHARGIKDSFGMHVDIGNRNLVYQYNYSEDNEGGFVEILGANVNVGYRYNLSIGDGWRSRGSQLGRIFWVGGWSGNPNHPLGSDSVFIYNNSIYVRDTIAPRIWIEAVTKNTRIYNNIVYVSGSFSDVFIKNDPGKNDFDYNNWYGNIPTTDTDGEPYRGNNGQTFNPDLMVSLVSQPTGFVLQKNSPALGAGKLIYNPAVNSAFDYYDNHGGIDYFGNPVSNSSPPNIGAYNGPGDVANHIHEPEIAFQLIPNPVKAGQFLEIQIPRGFERQIKSAQIMDVSGKTVYYQSLQGQQKVQLDTQNLAKGAYMVSIHLANQVISRQLVIW